MSLGFSSDRFNELSDVVLSLHTLGSRCATNKYFQIIGSIHDIESYFGIDNTASLTVQIVLCHSAHTSIILVWVSRNLFHIGWIGNYELFSANPIWTIPIGHAIFDPHFKLEAKLPLSKSTAIATAIAYNGIYNSVYTLGFNSLTDVYNFSITLELLALISIAYGSVHHELASPPHTHPPHNNPSPYLSAPPRFQIEIIHLHKKLNARIMKQEDALALHSPLNLMRLMGFLSIGWCAHLVDLGTPHRSSLTFFGGLKSNTISLYLTDIAHHHLAVGILFVVSTHLYLSLNHSPSPHTFGLTSPILNTFGRSTLNKSLDLQLSLVHTAAGYMTSVLSQDIYSLLPYEYLSYHYITTLALHIHHQYIASFLMMAVLSHTTIYLIRDYTIGLPSKITHNPTTHKSPKTATLSWISLFLGFHSSCVYIHNDTTIAFGSSSIVPGDFQ